MILFLMVTNGFSITAGSIPSWLKWIYWCDATQCMGGLQSGVLLSWTGLDGPVKWSPDVSFEERVCVPAVWTRAVPPLLPTVNQAVPAPPPLAGSTHWRGRCGRWSPTSSTARAGMCPPACPASAVSAGGGWQEGMLPSTAACGDMWQRLSNGQHARFGCLLRHSADCPCAPAPFRISLPRSGPSGGPEL